MPRSQWRSSSPLSLRAIAASALTYSQAVLAAAAAAMLVYKAPVLPLLAVTTLVLGLAQPLLAPETTASRREAARILILLVAMAALGVYAETLAAYSRYSVNAGVLVVTLLAPLVYAVAARVNPIPGQAMRGTLATLSRQAVESRLVHYMLLLTAIYTTGGGLYALPPLTLVTLSLLLPKARTRLLLAASATTIAIDFAA